MRTAGFLLTGLILIGTGVPDAEIRFTSGLNLIVGPSDTGKTFIAQCIDFALGAGKLPKSIPEARPYESIRLVLRRRDSENELTLERSLRGGDIRLYEAGHEPRTLGVVHKGDEDASQFLLDLSGLAGKRVRTNKQGKTRALSFRDVAQLVLIDEEEIISDRSPIFSGQFTKGTEESTVFRLLLTGIDDSSVIAQEDRKIVKGRKEGKSEVIEALLQGLTGQLADLNLEGVEPVVRDQLNVAEARFEAATSALAAEQASVVVIEERHRTAWVQVRHVESRLNLLSGLQARFALLETQYISDLRRLESIAEAGIRLGQMKEERCPVCGALAEHHHRQHPEAYVEPDAIAGASQAEARKIQVLLSDLRATVMDNQADIERLHQEYDAGKATLSEADKALREQLKPRMQEALQALRESQSQRDTYRRAAELYDRVYELKGMLAEARKTTKTQPAEGPATVVRADEAEGFSQEVEALLRDWHFPKLGRVTFSEVAQDIVISGQTRASHGKGVRAILHTAFNLALLRYCLTHSMPHPGVVLVDSPLVVYRQPDKGEEGFDIDVKKAFYQSLAESFNDAQVIVLENDNPPLDLDRSANVIKFTGRSDGRRGFVP